MNHSAMALSGFWGLILEPGKRYSKLVDVPFEITAAVLDTHTTGANKDEIVSVMLEVDHMEIIICSLSLKDRILQCPLNLKFGEGSRIAFFTTGADTSIHLSGNITLGKEKSCNFTTATQKRKKTFDNSEPLKKKKSESVQDAAAAASDDEDDDDEDDDDDEEESDDEEDDDDDEEEEEDEDEESLMSSSSDEIEVPSKKSSQKVVNSPKAGKKSLDLLKANEKGLNSPKAGNKTLNSPKAGDKTLNSPKAGDKTLNSPKVGDKNLNKPKAGDKNLNSPKAGGKPLNSPKTVDTPSSSKKAKKNKQGDKNSSVNGTPQKENSKNTPQKQNAENNGSSASQTPAKSPRIFKKNGVVCEDLQIGTGTEAQRGKHVGVYYEGRNTKTNKMFDKCSGGKPFRFRLGTHEIIQGWNYGIEGMRVGGRRKLVCPPNLAYGKSGAPPDIPPNAFLTFTVQLKSVS